MSSSQVMAPQPTPGSRDDRGSATLEIAVLGPALILLTFAFVQAGLYYHASSLVAAAAREGASAAASYNAPPGAGPARARAFLTAHAGDSVSHPTVSTDGTTPVIVRIQVTGTALSILPGIPGPTVRHTAQAPRERLTG
jgi:Flp pilus assembly protein TadG